jgi:hypothetical protein
LGANYAPVVVVRPPAKGKLPRHDEARFDGDLTAWFTEFCAQFPLEPATENGTEAGGS